MIKQLQCKNTHLARICGDVPIRKEVSDSAKTGIHWVGLWRLGIYSEINRVEKVNPWLCFTL